MKRRSVPDSSHTLARKPGYFESRLSSTSLTVAASTSTVSAPDVNLRSGVGITTLSDMVHTPKDFFECGELRLDHLWRREIQRVESLQSVSGDRQNRQIRFLDPALLHQFLRNRDGDAAGRLREDAFCFREQLNAGNDLLVRAVFSPAAGTGDQARGKVAVRGVADRERLRDGVRLHRTNLRTAAFHG